MGGICLRAETEPYRRGLVRVSHFQTAFKLIGSSEGGSPTAPSRTLWAESEKNSETLLFLHTQLQLC